jgi:hypothetical protein
VTLMSDQKPSLDRLFELVGTICDENGSPDEVAELDSVVFVDGRARRHYLRYCKMHSALRLELRANRATQAVCQQIDAASNATGPDALDIVTVVAPAPTFPSTVIPGTLGFFSSGWPVAYLIATVVVAVGLLVGSRIPTSRSVPIAQELPPAVDGRAVPEPGRLSVGQVTAMVGCRWAEGNARLAVNDDVAVGRKIKLESGLMEIAYDSGAKVILQGPVTYEVESNSGGYLAVGKLTARVEKGGERRGERGEGDASHAIPNPKSQITAPSPPSPLLSPLFVVRTPTATVTDLGTEFGVEVTRSGDTTSHVFRGSVRVQRATAEGTASTDGHVVRENETVRVQSAHGDRQIVSLRTFTTSHFIREMPRPAMKTLDLADMVAGGDGFSGRRDRGIDPTAGQPVDRPIYAHMRGDHQYHRVKGLPFVDGVFIPDGGPGPVQVDSAGHVFDGFRKTANIGFGYVWVGSGTVAFGETILGGVDYASPPHVAILLHANKGITFDLAAIRQANPGQKLLQFRATTGSTEMLSSAEKRSYYAHIIVLVDGRLRFRREVNGSHGAYAASVPIGRNDRFLTLAAGDSGDGYACDQVLFGDPVLEMTPEVE